MTNVKAVRLVGVAMEVYFFASGERLASLDAADFEGKTAKVVKQLLTAQLGVSRFRQRLFVADGSREIPDDEAKDGANNGYTSFFFWNGFRDIYI